jgi:prepilin-type N-terminal cleavage/methylation domain-containing protein
VKGVIAMRKGFTLIELLIVIAIIAILALIALPNFLEAQTRSKVSRAHADMRSIATGLEAYYTDYNDYPLSEEALSDGCVSPRITAGWRFSFWKMCLTTPVAYMSSLPVDPFFKITGVQNTDDHLRNYRYQIFRCLGDNEDFWNLGKPPHNHFEQIYKRGGYVWALSSPGPDRASTNVARILHGGKDSPQQVPYDPTNGTISTGEILRTNRGEFSGRTIFANDY